MHIHMWNISFAWARQGPARARAAPSPTCPPLLPLGPMQRICFIDGSVYIYTYLKGLRPGTAGVLLGTAQDSLASVQ